MKRKTKQAIKRTAIVSIAICGLLLILSVMSTDSQHGRSNLGTPAVSQQVRDYQPLIEKYADKYEIAEHVDVLMAMMMQESSGRGNDPMQASESYCGSRGCIDDPELSIKQGVHYFSETLEKADGELRLAVQSYNFGKGFIDYVDMNSETYTQEAAINFSREMYAQAEDQSVFRCPRDEAKAIDACYGDIYYVRDVMAYTKAVAEK
ncbi:lysozyme family protein [Lentibacillus salinarum]|uniref:Lysozyme family protein n=1 Tax=Lentibacillus salinarum TaxID=446820 RepID=A0ABW3ZYL3_9BACI